VSVDLTSLAGRVAVHGLDLRGAFHPESADDVPVLPTGRIPGTLVLVGNVGSGLWAVFAQSGEANDGAPHPLNRWTQRVLDRIAAEVDAAPLFPFGGPPYLPFQRWAMRAEPVAPSPLGILIHPDYGLWHAYRGRARLCRTAGLAAARRAAAPLRQLPGSPLPVGLSRHRFHRPRL